MSYCNFSAVKLALEAGPSLPLPTQKPGKRARAHRAHVNLLILITIARRINRESGETWLTKERIAEEALTSVSSVTRAIRELVASKHLIKVQGGRGQRDSNTYRLGPTTTNPTLAEEAAAPASKPAPKVDEENLNLDPTPQASEAALQLAARFAELLNQPKKQSALGKKWPGTFDAMLADHSHADLLALLEWVFSVDKFWFPKIRAYGGDPADYLTEKVDNILAAKAHPTMTRATAPDRNAPAPHSLVSDLLAASTI